MHRLQRVGALAVLLTAWLLAIALQYEPITGTPIVSGAWYDDAAVLLAAGSRFWLVYERLEGTHNDLYAISSTNGGTTWSNPVGVATGTPDALLGSLVELDDGTLALFYASNAEGLYRIHRATSDDGVTWTEHGAIDLHQLPASPVNPHVLVEDDGRLTMVYEILGANALFVAQSSDGGVTWDETPTQIGPFGATSPHIAHTADGGYLLTYQVGGADQDLYAQISDDPYTWDGQPIDIAVGENDGYDGFPVLLGDETLAVFYASSIEGAPADVYYRASEDGSEWDMPVQVTDAELNEIKPFAVAAGSGRQVHLVWSQEVGAGSDYDVYFQTDLAVRPLPTPTWTPGPPTATPTATIFLTPTETATWTPIPTRTSSPTPSMTPTETITPTVTLTPTPITPSPTATLTRTPTLTPTFVPRLALIPGDYPASVAAGDTITITWSLMTNRGANMWIEWGSSSDSYTQRHDFPWVPGGLYTFEYTITAPSRTYLYFRVTAVDDVLPATSWSERVRIAAHSAYVPLVARGRYP